MKHNVKPHGEHERHLCHLHNIERLLAEHPEEYKQLVRNAKYICIGCGRVAANQENLCAPRPLESSD
jgi:hypothetical protein